jgi:hypothetical protein
MDVPEDDLEFDFFEDEPATREGQSQSRVRLPRRGGRGPRVRRPAGPPRGVTPLLRLLALVAILVAALVVFGLLIESCASPSKDETYKSYTRRVTTVAASSQQNGGELATALTTQGLKVSDIVAKLGGIAQQEQQAVNAAEKIDPPGPLRQIHQNMVEALQLRVNGIQGLANAFNQTAASKSSTDASKLAGQAERLLASDVIWDDLFKTPAAAVMHAEGVTDVVPPASKFVQNQDLLTERSMTLILQRLRGASTGGGKPTGLHGTNIVETNVFPGGAKLSTDQQNTVNATPGLKFVVTVLDSGDSQEVGINVTLTIQKTGGAIVKTRTIALINPKQQKTVEFTNLGEVPFAKVTTANVDVAPVPGEHNTANNKASYPVIFSLG